MGKENGIIIGQAHQIMKRTYKELSRLKDDVADMLSEYDPSLTDFEEYSYGPNSLYLKANHTFLFKRHVEEQEGAIIREQRVLAVICIFDEEWDLNRISLKDQPELWVGLVDIRNQKGRCRPGDISGLLKRDRRAFFSSTDESLLSLTKKGAVKDTKEPVELRIGGYVFDYEWSAYKGEGVEKELWRGHFIGYPLVDISNREELKSKIIHKLFKAMRKRKA